MEERLFKTNLISSQQKHRVEAENRISNAEDVSASLETRLTDAGGKLDALTYRMDEQEVRSRRDNIGIIGVKEGIEGRNAFFETWLPKVLNLEAKKSRIHLDRCHRGFGRPKAGVGVLFSHEAPQPTIDKMNILAVFSA